MSLSQKPASGPFPAVSAHAGGFAWRAGGAMALASARGADVTVPRLSYGERGESAKAWREGKQLAEIRARRRAEASQAAAVPGATIEFAECRHHHPLPALRRGELGLDRHGLRAALTQFGVEYLNYHAHLEAQ
jgi:LmbE family N-acetylglucosaminyl deacetylase